MNMMAVGMAHANALCGGSSFPSHVSVNFPHTSDADIDILTAAKNSINQIIGPPGTARFGVRVLKIRPGCIFDVNFNDGWRARAVVSNGQATTCCTLGARFNPSGGGGITIPGVHECTTNRHGALVCVPTVEQ